MTRFFVRATNFPAVVLPIRIVFLAARVVTFSDLTLLDYFL